MFISSKGMHWYCWKFEFCSVKQNKSLIVAKLSSAFPYLSNFPAAAFMLTSLGSSTSLNSHINSKVTYRGRLPILTKTKEWFVPIQQVSLRLQEFKYFIYQICLIGDRMPFSQWRICKLMIITLHCIGLSDMFFSFDSCMFAWSENCVESVKKKSESLTDAIHSWISPTWLCQTI